MNNERNERVVVAARAYMEALRELEEALEEEAGGSIENGNPVSNPVSNPDSITERWLRILTMVKDAGGTVTGKEWRDMLRACGYDTRGGGGFYVGAGASMRRDADNSRVLTDAGKAYLAQHGEVR